MRCYVKCHIKIYLAFIDSSQVSRVMERQMIQPDPYQNSISTFPPISHEEMVDSYKQNFTIHGLSKVFTGTNCERVLWFVGLSVCLGTFAFFSHGFYKQYSIFDFRTEIQLKDVASVALPVLTICTIGVKDYYLRNHDGPTAQMVKKLVILLYLATMHLFLKVK